MFIEPDPTRLEVVDAWLGVQFWFKNTGDRTAKKNLSSGGDTLSLNIETAGIYLGTGKVFEFARELLPKISNIRAIPDTDMALPNSEIEPEIQDNCHHPPVGRSDRNRTPAPPETRLVGLKIQSGAPGNGNISLSALTTKCKWYP